MFEAVILMGGLGTRLSAISKGVPKPMMSVGGRPFVYHLLEKLEAAGCKRIVLSLHYEAHEIISQITQDMPVNCEIVFVKEDRPLGTGGGLKLAATSILGEKFIALNGDTFSSLDYRIFFFR
jgi:D-glycero-alpha-D-manno-heptose 1-phosphate guanylyltransferase